CRSPYRLRRSPRSIPRPTANPRRRSDEHGCRRPRRRADHRLARLAPPADPDRTGARAGRARPRRLAVARADDGALLAWARAPEPAPDVQLRPVRVQVAGGAPLPAGAALCDRD